MNPDLHYQYALERQQRLRAEAAAHRLREATPARSRLARLFGRYANRLDEAKRARDTAAKPIAERS